MMRKERVSRPSDRRGVTFGIVPKLLLSILCPLFAVLTLITVFLGLRSASTVNTVMNAELEAATEAAAASQELSGQAGMTREQISQFKLGQADGPAEAQGSPVPAGAAAGADDGGKY